MTPTPWDRITDAKKLFQEETSKLLIKMHCCHTQDESIF